MNTKQIYMPEGYVSDNVFEVLHMARDRQQVIPATILSIEYPNDNPTWVIGFRDFIDFKGYVPLEEMGVDIELVPRLIGQNINVNILGIDKENQYLACSRKSVVEMLEPKVKGSLVEGSIITAVIKAILPRTRKSYASLVVDIGGGLLSKIPSNNAKIRLSKPLDRQFVVGQNIRVKVLSTDPIEVSVKHARANPWQTTVFTRGQFLSGTILEIADDIVFIEPDLAPGIVGIAPYPIAGRIMKRDRVNCILLAFDNEEEKLKLNIKSRIM